MPRFVAVVALVSALQWAAATHAADPDGDAAARVQQLLSTIEARKTTAQQRQQAVEALMDIGPAGVDALEAHLARTRSASDADRRAVLAAINADVPDDKGRFSTPKRGEPPKDPDLDWLAGLLALDSQPRGYGEVVSDVAAIRALAASKAFRAGTIIFAFAFSETGLVYRDECGRYLRNMAPYSLPALIVGSNSKNGERRRYATYQLERLDRENSNKAMHYSPIDVQIAILGAYGRTDDRRAVLTVLNYVDDVAPDVRAAARDAWMDYITGPPPEPAPMKKLALPGGKLTEEEMPLWLTSRELADIFIRERLEQVMGEKPKANASLADMSQTLFAHYDAQRGAHRDAAFEKALALAESDPAAAAAGFDEILAADPMYPRRDEMADAYWQRAKQIKKDKDWTAAAVEFGKVYGVAPEGEHATRARAEQHYAQGRARMDGGGDPRADFERALELYPDHPGAQAALEGDDPDEADAAAEERPGAKWMFYAGLAGAAFAVLLLVLALARRRQGA